MSKGPTLIRANTTTRSLGQLSFQFQFGSQLTILKMSKVLKQVRSSNWKRLLNRARVDSIDDQHQISTNLLHMSKHYNLCFH